MTGVSVSDDFDILTATADVTNTASLAVGTHTVTYTVTDRAGNSDTKTRTIVVNVLAPVINSVTASKTDWTNEPVTVTVDAEAFNNKTIAAYSYDNGQTWETTNTKEVTENTTLTVLVKDSNDVVSTSTSITVSNIDKETATITTENVDAAGAPQATVNVNVTDNLSGVAEVKYVPKAYTSLEEYKKGISSATQPVEPLDLTLDANGNTTITAYFDSEYTIYAKDNAGNETIKTVSVANIDADGYGSDDESPNDNDSAVDTTIEGATITIGKTNRNNYLFWFFRVNPTREITVTANEGYTIDSVKWEEGRQTKEYFKNAGHTEETTPFTLGNTTRTSVYTLYVKTIKTATGEDKDGVIYIYNNAYWFWGIRF